MCVCTLLQDESQYSAAKIWAKVIAQGLKTNTQIVVLRGYHSVGVSERQSLVRGEEQKRREKLEIG